MCESAFTVVSYIESPSLWARDRKSFTYCMKTSFCRYNWCLPPFLSLTESVYYLWPGLNPDSVITRCTHRVDLASPLSTPAPGIFILFLQRLYSPCGVRIFKNPGLIYLAYDYFLSWRKIYCLHLMGLWSLLSYVLSNHVRGVKSFLRD